MSTLVTQRGRADLAQNVLDLVEAATRRSGEVLQGDRHAALGGQIDQLAGSRPSLIVGIFWHRAGKYPNERRAKSGANLDRRPRRFRSVWLVAKEPSKGGVAQGQPQLGGYRPAFGDIGGLIAPMDVAKLDPVDA